MENHCAGDGSWDMDELLDHTRNEIINYFGKPYMDFISLIAFSLKGGTVAIGFRMQKAVSYAVYDTQGNMICTNVNVKSIMSSEMNQYDKMPLSQFAAQYGAPHADIGSGVPLPVYFSDHGTFYKVFLTGNRISQIVECHFCP